MNLTDREVKEWLERHTNQLPPEELPFEEERMEAVLNEEKLLANNWPTPSIVPDIGEFAAACTQNGFNKVVGSPHNWETILKRQDLFEQWILPNAVLLFSKTWFDRVKWKNTIANGIPFPLFSVSDKQEAAENNVSLEQTCRGKALIAGIIAKTSYALRRYIETKLESKVVRVNENPGGYVIGAVKNELVGQIGTDAGFSLVSVVYCPLCASGKKGSVYKTPLTECGLGVFSCQKCKFDALQLETSQDNQELLEIVSKFELFSGASCVCINDKCPGRFIPISLIDNFPRELVVTFDGTQSFSKPPNGVLDITVNCPFCNASFTFNEAISKKTGFKSKSGWITGLPKMAIWENTTLALDIDDSQSIVVEKLSSGSVEFDLQIMAKQKFDILIGELLIHMNNVKKNSIMGLTTWFFYRAVFEWMTAYWDEAVRYFFCWESHNRRLTLKEMQQYPDKQTKRSTKVIRGQEVPIHRYIFQKWLSLLEENISEFRRFGSIMKLEDFPWFCRKPKFSNGPRSTFRSVVRNGKIANMTNIVPINEKGPTPRLAKIYSIFRFNEGQIDRSHNFVSDIKDCEWHVVKIKPKSNLCNGDQVRVEALMLPGHQTHAPIQRILRLRSLVLNDIICRVLDEEATGERNVEFWKDWEYKVNIAKQNLFKGE